MADRSSDVVRAYVLEQHGLTISDRTAREIVEAVRTTQPLDDDFRFEVRGTAADGTAGTTFLGRAEMRSALRRPPYGARRDDTATGKRPSGRHRDTK